MAQRAGGVNSCELEEVKREITGVLQAHDRRAQIIEEEIESLDGSARDVSTRADLDALW